MKQIGTQAHRAAAIEAGKQTGSTEIALDSTYVLKHGDSLEPGGMSWLMPHELA